MSARSDLHRSIRIARAIGPQADDLGTTAQAALDALDRYNDANSRVRAAARAVGIDEDTWDSLGG